MAGPVRLSAGLSEHKACSHSGWDIPQTGISKTYRKPWSLRSRSVMMNNSVCSVVTKTSTHGRIHSHEYINTWFFSSQVNVASSIPESPCWGLNPKISHILGKEGLGRTVDGEGMGVSTEQFGDTKHLGSLSLFLVSVCSLLFLLPMSFCILRAILSFTLAFSHFFFICFESGSHCGVMAGLEFVV